MNEMGRRIKWDTSEIGRRMKWDEEWNGTKNKWDEEWNETKNEMGTVWDDELTLCFIAKDIWAKFQFWNKKGSSKKKILWASRLWVGRRKEPILGYISKTDVK